MNFAISARAPAGIGQLQLTDESELREVYDRLQDPQGSALGDVLDDPFERGTRKRSAGIGSRVLCSA